MMRSKFHRTILGTTILAPLAITAPGLALAGPEGERLISGSATVERSGSSTVIRQGSHRADLSWGNFDIDRGESVRFDQPSRTSIALNRVRGASPSEIQGALSANGQVWLQNPNGVLIGRDAIVDVNGLLATSSRISPEDFAAGRDRFSGAGGSVVNEGFIKSGEGGVALVAPIVENAGRIASAGGDVSLHAGSAFTVDMHGDGLLSLVVEAEDPIATSLTNSGEISATGGSIHLSAAAAEAVRDSVITVSGLAQATGLEEVDGKIVLTGGGRADITGTLVATRGDTGGDVVIEATQVAVHGDAVIDVSAPSGGGSIIVGSRDEAAPTQYVAVGTNATLKADSTVEGDAGEMLFWSTDATYFYGTASAAARDVGDGGFIDISSLGGLAFDGVVDLSAATGELGTLLFDPATITVGSFGGDNAEIADGIIEFDDIAASGGLNMEITASFTETITGDIILQATDLITIVADLNLTDQSLTLESRGDIIIGSFDPPGPVTGNISITGSGSFTASATDTIEVMSDISVETGDILLNADVVQIGETVEFIGATVTQIIGIVGSLDVTTGDIDINAGSFANILGDVTIGTGDVTVTSGGDIFVESSNLTSGDRVELTAADQFVQASVVGGIVATIVSTGSQAGDGVFVTGGSVLVNGTIDSSADVGITATSGSIEISPQSAGPVPLQAGFTNADQPAALPGGSIIAAGDIAMDAATDILILTDGAISAGGTFFADAGGTINVDAISMIDASAIDWIAADYAIFADIFATSARVGFSGFGNAGFGTSGPGGTLDLDEIHLFNVTDGTIFALEDLEVGSIQADLPIPAGASLTLTAGGAVNITGFLVGAVDDGGTLQQYSISIGEEGGLRPSEVNVTGMGRIGVADIGGSELILAPDGLGFFVNGDVTIDPDVDGGGLILVADGLTTIDVTGDFIQRNTLAPGSTTQLVNGVGGAGAQLDSVLLNNAASLELYGTIGGLDAADARDGVTFGGGFTPTEVHQVNDCVLGIPTCLPIVPTDDEPLLTADKFPIGLLNPGELVTSGVVPNPEIRFGFLNDLAFIQPELSEEEPITNRGSEEDWPE